MWTNGPDDLHTCCIDRRRQVNNIDDENAEKNWSGREFWLDGCEGRDVKSWFSMQIYRNNHNNGDVGYVMRTEMVVLDL